MTEDIFEKAAKLIDNLPVEDIFYGDEYSDEVGKLSRNNYSVPVTENGYFCIEGNPLGLTNDITLDFTHGGYFYQVDYDKDFSQTWGSKTLCSK